MQNHNLLAKLSIQQLKRALEVKQGIADLEKELSQLLGAEQPAAAPAPAPAPRKRKMSAAAKARISAAQKALWAERKKAAAPGKATPPPKKKGKMSAAGRARIIAATKARWARFRAEKKKQAAA
jgi:hypothetical protein